jgi:hypothetical protein
MYSCVEDKNFLSTIEKNYINKEIINNQSFPFYWNEHQVSEDDVPFLSHVMKSRNSDFINSNIFPFFKGILDNFCTKHNIKYKNILRACINLTFLNKKNIGTIHKDHEFPHKQLIIYLNDSDGNTYLYNDNKKLIKEIIYKQYKIVCFDNCFHSAGFPKSKRRLICIITFN